MFVNSREVQRRAGITYRELDHWVRVGVAPCSVPAKGPGTSRMFDPRDVDQIVGVAMLRHAGVDLTAIARADDLSAFLRALESAIADAKGFLDA